jgi:hypothetical protein
MAVTHSTFARNLAADTVLGLLNVGGAGTLQFQTSGGVPCATLVFTDPAFQPAVNGVATANPVANDSNAAGGLVSQFALTDNASTEVIFGSVTTPAGTGDIRLSSLNLSPGDVVVVTSLLYATMP